MNPRKTISPIGGLQPLLFCIGMYFVALFFSIFVCSSIFYAINPKKDVAKEAAADSKSVAYGKKMYVMR
jgi:hypothetical protein